MVYHTRLLRWLFVTFGQSGLDVLDALSKPLYDLVGVPQFTNPAVAAILAENRRRKDASVNGTGTAAAPEAAGPGPPTQRCSSTWGPSLVAGAVALLAHRQWRQQPTRRQRPTAEGAVAADPPSPSRRRRRPASRPAPAAVAFWSPHLRAAGPPGRLCACVGRAPGGAHRRVGGVRDVLQHVLQLVLQRRRPS